MTVLPEPLPGGGAGEIAQVLDGDGLVVASSANASRTLPVVAPSELPALKDGPATMPTAYDERARVVAQAATGGVHR